MISKEKLEQLLNEYIQEKEKLIDISKKISINANVNFSVISIIEDIVKMNNKIELLQELIQLCE